MDALSDLWAAGVALYEMAMGRHPSEGKTLTALADHILHAQAPARQELQPRLSQRLESNAAARTQRARTVH